MCLRTVSSCIILTLGLSISVNGDKIPHDAITHVNKLSDQIRMILEHYKNPDPVGIPGIPIPDPMPVPDLKHDIGFTATLEIKNATVNGLSKFHIDHVFSNLVEMMVEVIVYIEKLEVLGNYTLGTWISKSKGGCNATLTDVNIQGYAKLEVTRLGILEAAEINTDIVVGSILLDFKNLGFLASLFQGAINNVGPFILDSIKPFILGAVNNDIRENMNVNLRSFSKTYPNSLPPIDIAIAEGRKMFRTMKYDPFSIDNYHYDAGIFALDVTDMWIRGLGSFYRIGDLNVLMENNTLHVKVAIGTQQLKGNCRWEISSSGILSKTGKATFTIEYLHVESKLNQSMDIRQKPILDDLKLELGNIQLRVDGTETLDYILEAIANILPNVFRAQIITAIEGPLKTKVQEILDSYDFEKIIEEKLPELDHLHEQNNNTFTNTKPELTLVNQHLEEELHVNQFAFNE